jgi:hypothetical protein
MSNEKMIQITLSRQNDHGKIELKKRGEKEVKLVTEEELLVEIKAQN